MKKYDKSRVPFLYVDREIAEEMVETLSKESIANVFKSFIGLFNGQEFNEVSETEKIFIGLLYKKAMNRLEGYLRQHPTKEERDTPQL